MSIRSGPDQQIRASAVYAAIDTWYACDTLYLGNNADSVRLYCDCTIADAGKVAFKIDIVHEGTDYESVNGNPVLGMDLSTGESKCITLSGLSLCVGDTIQVWFKCSGGAASSKLAIGALAYSGLHQPTTLGYDNSTASLQTIKYEHHEQHAGSHWFYKTWEDITGNGTASDFLFVTPDTAKAPHFKMLLSAEAEFTLAFYEGATTSADGTPVAPVNNNRNIGTASTTLMYDSPTVSAVGTQIWIAKVGSGKKDTGIAPGVDYEVVLKRNTKYLFRATKAATGTHWLDMDFFWYEHTPKG